MYPFNFDDNEAGESSFAYERDYVDGLNEYTLNNPLTGFPNDGVYKNEQKPGFDRGRRPERDGRGYGEDRRGYDRDRRRPGGDRRRPDRDRRRDGEHDGGHIPKSAPPRGIPSKNQRSGLFAVDPIAIRGCLYKYAYIWLVNRQQFWMYPTYVGRDSVAGYRWNGYRWTYTGFDLKLVESFSCVG